MWNGRVEYTIIEVKLPDVRYKIPTSGSYSLYIIDIVFKKPDYMMSGLWEHEVQNNP